MYRFPVHQYWHLYLGTFSSTATLAALLRYSFPVQQHWRLLSGIFFSINTGSFTQVQPSRKSKLAAIFRHSFPVQLCWKLFSCTVFKFRNSGMAIMADLLRYNNTDSFTQVRKYWQLSHVLVHSYITVQLSYINRYNSSVQHYWQLCSSTNTGSSPPIQHSIKATLAVLTRVKNSSTAKLADLFEYIIPILQFPRSFSHVQLQKNPVQNSSLSVMGL